MPPKLMDKGMVTQMPRSSINPEPKTRELRGLALFRERGEEIVAYTDGTYGVPSRTRCGVIYHVDLDGQGCECADRVFPCQHGFAAELKHARIAAEGARRMDEVRRRSAERRRERIVFSAEQIAANLARMGA